MSKEFDSFLWTEKYRPQTVPNIILPSSLKAKFTKMVKTKNIPNMLFHSNSPGPGKSSTAKAICNDCQIDYLYVNASLDRNIDILRDDIQSYATTLSLDLSNSIKVVILDEFDGALETLQKALSASIEQFSEFCRFIIICNNLSKIKKEIKSRCEPVDFNFCDEKVKNEMVPKIYKRLTGILTHENVQFDKETIGKLIVKCYPDIRCMIKLMQQCSDVSGIVNNDIFNIQDVDIELCNLILNKKITAARQFVLDNGYDYDNLYSVLFNKLVPQITDKIKCAKAIITIEDYQRVSPVSLDKELTFVACMFRLLEDNLI
jgi:DNA polymerase III delta prime subunit